MCKGGPRGERNRELRGVFYRRSCEVRAREGVRGLFARGIKSVSEGACARGWERGAALDWLQKGKKNDFENE